MYFANSLSRVNTKVNVILHRKPTYCSVLDRLYISIHITTHYDMIYESRTTFVLADGSCVDTSPSESISSLDECTISGGVTSTSQDSSILHNHVIIYDNLCICI